MIKIDFGDLIATTHWSDAGKIYKPPFILVINKMDVSEALLLIKSGLKKELVESKHFLDQCKDRNLDMNSVKKVIKDNDILGILEQDKDLYKIWFFYEQRKDLNIILKILPDKRLRLVTIFSCYSERRKR